MVPCRTQGVARDVRPPRRRDRLHRRTRSTLDTKRRGAVTRETHRCDQALRNRTTLFFRSTDPSNHIDPSEHISSTGESIQRESAFVHSNHKLLVDVRAIPARHRGICHCVPHNEGDNLGEHGRRGRLWQVTVTHHSHGAQSCLRGRGRLLHHRLAGRRSRGSAGTPPTRL